MLVDDSLEPVYSTVLKRCLDGREFSVSDVKELQLSDESFTKNGIYGFDLYNGTINYFGRVVTEFPGFVNGTVFFVKLKDGVFIPCHEKVQAEVDSFNLSKEFDKGTKKIRKYDVAMAILGVLILIQFIVL